MAVSNTKSPIYSNDGFTKKRKRLATHKLRKRPEAELLLKNKDRRDQQGVTDKMEGAEILKKQKTGSIDNSKTEEIRDGENEADMDEVNFAGSEEMELGISHIHEKVEHFNQLVSELLENGKLLFSKLSNDFEERVLMIHREQIEKWEEEMKELRMLDSNNEEMNSCLENAKCVLQSMHGQHVTHE